MKIMAIGTITSPITPQRRAEIMPREVAATLQLYLDGKVEQYWFRSDKPGVIFYMNAESIEAAKADLDALPLVAENVMTYEYIPVGPLAPLGMLLAKH